MLRKIQNVNIQQVFDTYPTEIKQQLLVLRELIFQLAEESEDIGEIEETLKWGQPSYLTKNKSGSTIRIDRIKNSDADYAIYFHCSTTLVDTFKELYGNLFCYEGNRAIIFSINEKIPVKAISHCIYLALTYHARKKI